MPQYLNSFIHLVFIGFVALFPVVNPVGTAFIVNPYFISQRAPKRGKKDHILCLSTLSHYLTIGALDPGTFRHFHPHYPTGGRYYDV
ncbi:hypothetical protein [Mucilaginibacter sp. HD30]